MEIEVLKNTWENSEGLAQAKRSIVNFVSDLIFHNKGFSKASFGNISFVPTRVWLGFFYYSAINFSLTRSPVTRRDHRPY